MNPDVFLDFSQAVNELSERVNKLKKNNVIHNFSMRMHMNIMISMSLNVKISTILVILLISVIQVLS